jgi:hypothetical protein
MLRQSLELSLVCNLSKCLVGAVFSHKCMNQKGIFSETEGSCYRHLQLVNSKFMKRVQ